MLSVSLRHRHPGFSLDVSFEAPTPGVVALFGPSGSGKSSVVAAVAGLLRAEHCRVVVDGEELSRLAPERRRVGLVFQDSRLFPHMAVAANLRYGLRRAAPGGAIGFDAVVALLGLERLLARRPGTLSGGEKQRVAIGRALLSQPRLLLMDEPLASLDAGLRDEILPFLGRLRTELALPVLYVTHALDEVARLADTLVLIEAGQVAGAGPVAAVAGRADLALARRDDAAGLLRAVVAGHDAARGLTAVTLEGGTPDADAQTVWLPLLSVEAGAVLRLRVPAREVILATEVPRGISVHNVLHCRVAGVTLAGGVALVALVLDEQPMLARVTPDAVARLGLRPGGGVLALVKSVAVEVLGVHG
ncbi:MAG: molybdenum ABC transporter ATP-binding protein [Janthinobacterium lividum]